MANVVQAILTNAGHQALAQSFGGPSGGFSWSYGQFFKIGTGGWSIQNGEKEPVTPSAVLTDIQAVTSGIFWYRKSFSAGNILFISPSTIQFQAFLDLAYANGNSSLEPDTATAIDGPKNSSSLSGSAPEFFEIGIFDAQNNMVAYGTFPQEVKLNTKTLNHLISINF
jgi:hypothetical protein